MLAALYSKFFYRFRDSAEGAPAEDAMFDTSAEDAIFRNFSRGCHFRRFSRGETSAEDANSEGELPPFFVGVCGRLMWISGRVPLPWEISL